MDKKWIIGLIAAASMYSAVFAQAPPASRPNILWIFSDDHSYQTIGAYGERFQSLNPTPNLDRLAREGMRFDRCYVANSICGPSRATLLTGKHSHMNGKLCNVTGHFDHNQQQFQKILQTNGYQTAMIGKIHLNGKMQGFDYWEVLPGQGVYNNPSFITAKGKTQYKGYVTDIITDRALNWLQNGRDADKPFMLMIHHKAAHRNWMPAQRDMGRYEDVEIPEPESLFDDYAGRGSAAHLQDMSIDKTMRMDNDLKIAPKYAVPGGPFAARNDWYAAHKPEGADLVRWKYQLYMKDYLRCIWAMDENIGRVIRKLEEMGLADNTIIMYSSDQGFYNGEHGWFDKRFMYEESFRTPFIAWWPGKIKPGSVNTDLVQNIDFAETFLDLAHAPIPEEMQGCSVVPLLKGQTPADWRKSIYYQYYEYPRPHHVFPHEGVFDGRYKLIRFHGADVPGGEEWELYDLKTDPREMQSMYNHPEMSGVVKRMKEELVRLKTQYRVPEDLVVPDRQKSPGAPGRSVSPKTEVVYHADPARSVYEPKIDVAGRPLTITVHIHAESDARGVILAQGGRNSGYALYVEDGRPVFIIRQGKRLIKTVSSEPLPAGRVILTVELTKQSSTLSINGRKTASGEGYVFYRNPIEGLSIGYDFVKPNKPLLSCVGEWSDENRFSGTVQSVEIK